MWCDGNDSIKADTPDHIQITSGAVFDDAAWQFLTSRVPKYRAFDEFEDFHHPTENPPSPKILAQSLGRSKLV